MRMRTKVLYTAGFYARGSEAAWSSVSTTIRPPTRRKTSSTNPGPIGRICLRCTQLKEVL
jgi:hypothetical protein